MALPRLCGENVGVMWHCLGYVVVVECGSYVALPRLCGENVVVMWHCLGYVVRMWELCGTA